MYKNSVNHNTIIMACQQYKIFLNVNVENYKLTYLNPKKNIKTIKIDRKIT